jgi:hypothetical protein
LGGSRHRPAGRSEINSKKSAGDALVAGRG